MINTAISSGARGLRTSRSLGALRSAAASQHVAATAAVAPPPLPTCRTLVSTVLLSRDAYDSRNVAQLKEECKTRGLVTSGRRADIVTRLLNDDAHVNGSGLREEAPPKKTATSSKGLRRTNSSLASLRGGGGGKGKGKGSAAAAASSSATGSSPSQSSSTEKKTASAPKPETPAPTAESSPTEHTVTGEGASIPHPTTIRPGQVAQAGQAPESTQASVSSIETPEKLQPDSNPPGVPPQKEPSHHPETFRVELPFEQVAAEQGPAVPIVTMYTRQAPAEQEAPIMRGPKVVTASMNSDVVHALDTAQASELPGQTAQALSSAVQTLKADAGLQGKNVESQVGNLLNATKIPQVAAKASEVASSLVKDASASVENATSAQASATPALDGSSSSGRVSSSNTQRGFNGEEKRGLYVLGGLIFGGFLAGGLGKKKAERKDAH